MAQTFNYNKPAFETPLLSVDVRRNFQALVTSNSGAVPPPNPVDGMWWLKSTTYELYYHSNGSWHLFATYNTTTSQWEMASVSLFSVTAGENIQGGRAVFIALDGFGYKSDKGVLDEVKGILGISTGAIAVGTTGLLQINGAITDSTWSWTKNAAVYCGVDGVLTHTPPTTGNLRRLAVAASATTLVMEFGETMALA